MDPTAVIVAALGAMASIAAAVGTARAASRGARATESVALHHIEADAAKRAREVYEGALDRMQREIDRQAAQINALQRQIYRLTRQVRAAGLVPVTSSEEDDP
ncbi:hypothetical protein ACQEVF_59580 [Nonomuraea polychroma]|uniref:hypothetical protein n=1 Tax=Nonomuraea polychroma TaxID=46176 RepID=UPI003D8CF2E6